MLAKALTGFAQQRVFLLAVLVGAIVGGSLTGPASALASAMPSIDSVSVSGITNSDATLEAQINPNGLETTYELYLSSPACQAHWPEIGPCMVIQDFSVPGGTIPAASGDQTVSVDLNSVGVKLQAGTWYEYSVSAHNAAGRVPAGRSTEQDFKTLSTSAGPPSIESESVSHLTSTDATLGAKINPESLEHGADYQFQLVANTSEYLQVFACPTEGFPANSSLCGGDLASEAGALPIGTTGTGVQGETVSLDLSAPRAWWSGTTALKPGTTYHYRVITARSVPTEDTIQWEDPIVYGADHTFTTPAQPEIDSVSISGLTPSDATLEAQINTEGLETMYEFVLTSHHACESANPPCEPPIYLFPLPSGTLLGSFVDQSVSIDLNSAHVKLAPGEEYSYSVSATSAAGNTSGHPQTFTTPEEGVQPLNTTTSPGLQLGAGTESTGGVTIAHAVSATTTGQVTSPPKNTLKPKVLTNAQKLAKALKVCAKKPKKQRAACKKRAHNRYGATAKRSAIW